MYEEPSLPKQRSLEEKLASGELLPLIDWEKLKPRLFAALGIDAWPDRVLETFHEADPGGELDSHLRAERIHLFEAVNWQDFQMNTDNADERREWLASVKEPPEGELPDEEWILAAERQVELFAGMIERGEPGLVLFVVKATDLPKVQVALATLPPTAAKAAILVCDPPHRWRHLVEADADIPCIELEDRRGIEMVSPEARERAKQRLLDILSPRFGLGPIPKGLVRALRKALIPSADIGLERELIDLLYTPDKKVYRSLIATQGERERRWLELPPSVRETTAALLEAYLRPIEGDRHGDGRYQEPHDETVLRLAVLDPGCLPQPVVEEAKQSLRTYLQAYIDDIERDPASHQAVANRYVLSAFTDRVLLDPEVNETYQPVLAFCARIAVDGFLSVAEARTKSLFRAVQERLERAKEAGCDVSEEEERLEAVDTRLLPEAVPAPLPSLDQRLQALDQRVLVAALSGDIKEVADCLRRKHELLRPQRRSPHVDRSDALGVMSIVMNMASAYPDRFPLETEITRLDEEFQRRLRVYENPSPAQIEGLKKLLLNEWRTFWNERLYPKA